MAKTDSYLVTARAFRPQTFGAVVGQEHVTRTLKNALVAGRLSHGFLFSGPRGVGKTTLARLLAKAINCDEGRPADPCDACPTCTEIREGRSLDYVEIDGASNRGIDQIRELNQNLSFASARAKTRVFVIDEVHMLTIEAFNALLKNLEEPPPKVVFVFCTTEVHKVPATIRSRCQHHRFRSFTHDEIRGQLATVLKAEGKPFDEDALFLIARAANGSMRDSQSLLDQVSAYSGASLTAPAVREVWGLGSDDEALGFVESLAKESIEENRERLSRIRRSGTDARIFFQEVLRLVNALSFMKAGAKDPVALDLSPTEAKTLEAWQGGWEPRHLFLISDEIFELLRELRKSHDETVLLGYSLLRLHRYKSLITAEELRADLDAVLAGAPAPQAAETAPPAKASASTPAPASPASAPRPVAPAAPVAPVVKELPEGAKAALEVFGGTLLETDADGEIRRER